MPRAQACSDALSCMTSCCPGERATGCWSNNQVQGIGTLTNTGVSMVYHFRQTHGRDLKKISLKQW